jgi:hypothetical protein
MTFANTVCYPFYSRFLHADDPRRLKRPPRVVAHHTLLYNLRNEESGPPTAFNYETYISDGLEFINRVDKRIKAVNGVKGIWAFSDLPYAHKIWMTKDRMHTANHVVVDTLSMMSRSVNGHVNRTEKRTVRLACEYERIFPFLYAEEYSQSAPWVANSYIEANHDSKLKNVIGAVSVEVPKRIWKKGHGRTSQETIMYGSDGWATWCLYCPEVLPSQPYIENKLKLFDVLRILNSSRIKGIDVSSIYGLTIDALVEHSALFPPTEQTYALHELVHIVQQIPKIGPPKFNNLFMYERVNSTLKRMIKNKCNSMASIVKAYAVIFLFIVHVFLMYYSCFSHVLLMFFSCITHVFLMFFSCIIHVFLMYLSCISK